MPKQLTFNKPTTATKILNGVEERITFGYYESVMITKENGHPVDRNRILIIPTFPVKEVDCLDGSKVMFDEPPYFIEIL